MTSNNCAIFKIFLKIDDTTEIRKVVIDDASVITSYLFIREKLQALFPKLRDANFRITWRDTDGDDVTIENDDDLILAFTEMGGPLKTLTVTVLSYSSPYQHNPQFTNVPPHIVCDVCNNEITAYRYKCLQCLDYDLCANCEHAGHHSNHIMLRTSTPDLPFARCGRRFFDHVNKIVRKASYRDCKKKSKWEKKGRPECGDNNDAGDGQFKKKEARASGCPFEDYIPQFYPIIDVISNAANAAASAAASTATASQSCPQTKTPSQPTNSSQPTTPKQTKPSAEQKQASNVYAETNSASQLMEVIRNALNDVFVQPPSSQQQQEKAQPPNTQTYPTAPNAPGSTESEVDLTKSPPTEPMETCQVSRETGWTIFPEEETVLQVEQVPQVRQVHYPLLPPLTPQQALPQDPKIMEALSQLLEMGFSDEQALIALLKRFNGNVDEVIKHIFGNK